MTELVTKNVKCLLAFNDRFLMEGPRWGNFETKGYIGLHNYTRPVPPRVRFPQLGRFFGTTWPKIIRNSKQRADFAYNCAVPTVEEIARSGNTFWQVAFSSLQQFVTKFSICCLIGQQISHFWWHSAKQTIAKDLWRQTKTKYRNI